jgi:hypothetical protein
MLCSLTSRALQRFVQGRNERFSALSAPYVAPTFDVQFKAGYPFRVSGENLCMG